MPMMILIIVLYFVLGYLNYRFYDKFISDGNTNKEEMIEQILVFPFYFILNICTLIADKWSKR